MTHLVPALVAAALALFAVWRRRRRSGERQRHAFGLPAFVHGDVALVAAREIRQRARGRLYRAVTVVLVLGVGAAVVVPTLSKGGPAHRTVGVVGPLSGDVHAVVVDGGRTAHTQVSIRALPSQAAAEHDLLAGRVDLVLLDRRSLVTKTSLSNSDTSTTARLAHALAAGLGQIEAVRLAGLSSAQLAALRASRPLPIRGLRPAPRRTGSSAAVLGVILLFVLLSQYNSWILIGVMEEKASRVVEVLLATVRPRQLLAGKVIGIGVLVLAQAGLVVAVALGLAAAVGSHLLQGAGPSTVVTTLLWLLLGYAFYSWLYAAAGSMAERQEQVQSIAIPIAIPMIVGYVAALSLASNGTPSSFVDALAYLPPTAPFVMPVLVSLGDVSWWQVALSATISVATTILVVRLAAGIYQRAVLRTGRRVRLSELKSARAQ